MVIDWYLRVESSAAAAFDTLRNGQIRSDRISGYPKVGERVETKSKSVFSGYFYNCTYCWNPPTLACAGSRMAEICIPKMALTFQRVSKACPSRSANVWQLSYEGRQYLLTPAHVAVYVDKANSKWTRSRFLNDFANMKWHIPASYVASPSPYNDFAWSEIHNGNMHYPIENAIELDPVDFDPGPIDADIFYRQPYNHQGEWVGSHSTLARDRVTLFRSPSAVRRTSSDFNPDAAEAVEEKNGGQTVLAEDSDKFMVIHPDALAEASGVGFRGMSGAIALSEDQKCIGMFVKRGSVVPFKSSLSPSLGAGTYTRAQSAFRSFLGLDQISAQLAFLTENTLTKSDIHELAVVFDAKRGIFLPAKSFVHSISTSPTVPLEDLVGKSGPVTPKQ